ncbi:MAG: HEAT repeat domain-containing protein, partial [Planctomycetales bacterium]|nr:HEAT repeat domain-containing protein [Planctomycetales bacterium]
STDHIDAAVKALANAADARDPQIANGALHCLARIGRPAIPALDVIWQQLESRDQQRRYRAAFAAGNVAGADDAHWEQYLQHNSAPVRASTAEAIGYLGAEAAPLVPRLVALHPEEDDEIRNAVRNALLKIGAPAGPVLVASLQQPKQRDDVRAWIAQSLGEINADSAVAREALQAACRDGAASVRAAAITALARIDAQSPATRQLIVADLTDDDLLVCQAAISAIIRQPELVDGALSELLDCLERDEETATLAALALGRLGPEVVESINTLLVKLNERNATAVLSALTRIGPVAMVEVLAAARRDQLSIEQAVQVLTGMGPQIVDQLQPATASANAKERAIACLCLGALTTHVEPIARLLQDSDAMVRGAAVRALASMEAAAAGTLDQLQPLTGDEDPRVRAEVVEAIYAIVSSHGEADQGPIAEIAMIGLADDDPMVRQRAAAVLGKLDKIPESVSAALVKALNDPNPSVRAGAIGALGRSDEGARNAMPQLIAASRDESVPVVVASAQALGQIMELDSAGVEALIGLLDHLDADVQQAAIESLGTCGTHDPAVATALLDRTNDSQPRIRIAALQSLARVLPSGTERLGPLISALDDDDWAVRREATQVLAGLREEATAAVPALLERMLSHSDDRDAIAEALRQIDNAPPDAVPVLLRLLEDEQTDRRSRFYALHLLRKVGPAAKEALPVLQRMRDTSD